MPPLTGGLSGAGGAAEAVGRVAAIKPNAAVAWSSSRSLTQFTLRGGDAVTQVGRER